MQGLRAGQYEKLDFAYLVELARIDVQLRQTILGMCLDIEHFLKVQLIRAIEQDPNEDGYSIVLDYVFDSGNTTFAERAHNASPRAHAISNKLEKNKNNPYCGGLITKYNGEMPVWVFIEIISFGDLLRFVEYVSNKINWTLPVDIKTLDRVRQIRNAAAHNNCIINDLTPNYKTGTKVPECNEPVYITQFVRSAGVAKPTMQKKLSNRRFSQIIHLLYAFDVIVTSSNSRQLRFTELKNLVNTRMLANKKYFVSNQLLDSTYSVLSAVVNSLH
jgi:abortive infection bacteriophage resistance protein